METPLSKYLSAQFLTRTIVSSSAKLTVLYRNVNREENKLGNKQDSSYDVYLALVSVKVQLQQMKSKQQRI